MYGSCRYWIGGHSGGVGMLDSMTMVVVESCRPRDGRFARVLLVVVVLGAAACSHDWDGVVDESPADGTGGGSGAGGSGAPLAGAAGNTGGVAGGGGVSGQATGGSGTGGGGASDSGSGGALPGGGGAAVAGAAGAAGTAAAAGAAGTGGVAGSGGVSGTGGAAGGGGVAGTPVAAGAAGQGGAPLVDFCDGNLVHNGGFETLQGVRPAEWALYEQLNGRLGEFSGDDGIVYAGAFSLVIDTTRARVDQSPYRYSVASDTYVAVAPGETLTLTLAVRITQAGPGGLLPRARFVYYDSAQVHLPDLDGDGFDLDAGDQFELLSPFQEQVPDGAGYAMLVLTVQNDVVVHVDNVCLTR